MIQVVFRIFKLKATFFGVAQASAQKDVWQNIKITAPVLRILDHFDSTPELGTLSAG